MADLQNPKKSFEFRMSKKVAELTQVVHMLFTRNHEKEVEIDSLKEAYEYEISLILDDAQQKVVVLETKILDWEKRCAAQTAKLAEAVERESKGREEEWAKRLMAAEKQLQDEKSECQNLRDLLIQTQKDVEKLRQSALEDSSAKTTELQAKDEEIAKLKKLNTSLERRLKEQQTQEEERATENAMTTERLTMDITQLQELLEETHRVKENVIAKNRQLESDLKTLRKDFGRKVSEIVSSKSSAFSVAQPSYHKLDYNDEIDRLRREVQKYRMELSNRDVNFNRMFTAKQPVVVDPRAGKIGLSQIQAVNPNYNNQTPPKTAREKSFSFAVGQAYDQDIMPARSMSSASSHSRLPCLPPQDQRGRIQRLLKPRPIPKAFLLSKT